MKLYSESELDEKCPEFRPIPFKLQAAMFGTYNQTGMNPAPPSSFHNMTTADTSEELKKRYFDLYRNPERIEPDKRRGHFITQRINAIDVMNRRRWFEARGRVPDDYDILVQSGEELNAMFRAEISDLPIVPLPRIPDAEGAGGDVDIGGIAREVVTQGIRGGVPAIGSVLGSRAGAAIGGLAGGPVGASVGGQVGGLAGSAVGRNLEAFLRSRMAPSPAPSPAPLPTQAPVPPPPGLLIEAPVPGPMQETMGVYEAPAPPPPERKSAKEEILEGDEKVTVSELTENLATLSITGRTPTMSDAVEYEQSLRDKLIRGMKNMASEISKRNQEIQNMGSEDVQSNQVRTATNEFERDYGIVEQTLKDMVTVVDIDSMMVDLADIDLQAVQEEQMKDAIQQAQMKNPEADFSRQEGAIRRQGRGLPKLFEEERQETRLGMEAEQQEARREGLSGLSGYGF